MEKHPYVYFSQNLSLITHTIKLINAATNPLSVLLLGKLFPTHALFICYTCYSTNIQTLKH